MKKANECEMCLGSVNFGKCRACWQCEIYKNIKKEKKKKYNKQKG